MDAHNLSFPDSSIGTIIIVETLEHIENPIKVMEEIYRVLKNEGLAIMTSSMNFDIHNYPSDYWRFTPQGFLLLLKKFDTRIIGFQGNPLNPHTVFGIGIKRSFIDIETFQKFCNILISELRESTHTFDENISFNYYENDVLRDYFVKKRIISRAKAIRNKIYLYICKIYNSYLYYA
jgi:SAM-dependent methyltransferase